MKSYIATALLALAVYAEEESVTATETIEVSEMTIIEEPTPAMMIPEGDVLMDYVNQQDELIGTHHVEIEETHKDKLIVVDDPYHVGNMISVDGEACERAIGHDGHYDEDANTWMLENDLDYEPEWRCLMRPLLREQVKAVGAAELSIESKGILEEKQALVRVHERLVKEAEKIAEKKNCLEYIERKMSKYQECELKVLRAYTLVEANYPASWTEFLVEKKKCVMTFAEEVHDCSTLFVWSVEGLEGHPSQSMGPATVTTMDGKHETQRGAADPIKQFFAEGQKMQ